MVCREFGPPDSLVYSDVPDPTPGPGEVVVQVHAAAVNFPDLLFMTGGYQVQVPPPFVPGSEFAGEVTAVGPDTDLHIGDRVSGSVLVGAFAEKVLAPQRSLVRLPQQVDLAEAAAFGVVYRTAYYTLRTVAPVESGDWVVILGAGGGVGMAALDIAVAMGARVIAAASAAKLEVCRQRGASATIDYDAEPVRDRIKEITGGQGARLVLDPVGGHYAEPALRGLGRGGRFITLGYVAGIPAIPLNLVLLKGITIAGMEIRTFMADHPDQVQRNDAELYQMFGDGRLRPHLGARFPLERAGAALRLVADRQAVGKVVIEM